MSLGEHGRTMVPYSCIYHEYLPIATPVPASDEYPMQLATVISSPTQEQDPASWYTTDNEDLMNTQEETGSSNLSMLPVGQLESDSKAKVLTLIEDLHELANIKDASALKPVQACT